jgi:phosphatidylinositol alpha-1,6-mannosyltransferase
MDECTYKGHREMIATWPKVLQVVPDARLAIAGRGPSLDLFRRQAAASGAAGSIDFLGFVSEEELERLYARATVLAMPSRGEGFGLVYIEAMRHGVPVLASVHDAAPEINLDGVTGYNVDLDRKDDLADRLIRLLRDRDLGARLGAAGRERWKEHFRFASFRARFAPLLERFLRDA